MFAAEEIETMLINKIKKYEKDESAKAALRDFLADIQSTMLDEEDEE